MGRAAKVTTFMKGARHVFSPVLKVPGKIPLFILIQVIWREGKALGSGKINYEHTKIDRSVR
jgi:hypothetical protein